MPGRLSVYVERVCRAPEPQRGGILRGYTKTGNRELTRWALQTLIQAKDTGAAAFFHQLLRVPSVAIFRQTALDEALCAPEPGTWIKSPERQRSKRQWVNSSPTTQERHDILCRIDASQQPRRIDGTFAFAVPAEYLDGTITFDLLSAATNNLNWPLEARISAVRISGALARHNLVPRPTIFNFLIKQIKRQVGPEIQRTAANQITALAPFSPAERDALKNLRDHPDTIDAQVLKSIDRALRAE